MSRIEPTEGDVARLGLVRPPLVYLMSIVVGMLIHLAAPLPFVPPILAVPLGATLVVVAIAVFSLSVAKFQAAGTPVPARKPTTAIVRSGPYRFGRNPIPCVLGVSARYRDLGQQPVAAGDTRWSAAPHALRRHTQRRAVLGATIRCRVLGIQGRGPPLALIAVLT